MNPLLATVRNNNNLRQYRSKINRNLERGQANLKNRTNKREKAHNYTTNTSDSKEFSAVTVLNTATTDRRESLAKFLAKRRYSDKKQITS